MEFKTLSEYRKHCKENGSHWFSRDTMNFFGSRIESHLKSGRWFIESQRSGFSPDSSRVYILRYIAQEKAARGYFPIEKFAEFTTLADAKTAFKAVEKHPNFPLHQIEAKKENDRKNRAEAQRAKKENEWTRQLY